MPEHEEDFHPISEQEVEEIVKWALATKTPLEIVGHGTRRAIGHGVEAGARLHMDRFAGIIAYEPEELVVSAWAGTPLAEVKALLAAKGQHLAFEPPDFSDLFEAGGAGTLGGAIASGFAGPRRLIAGSARDHILGLTGVTGRGETFKIGGRVVKNVTGYDLSKLLTGSFGTLAAMTRVTMKILPRPETVRTLHVANLDRSAGLELLRRAVASPFSVTGAVLVDGRADGASGCFLRLDGRGNEIDVRLKALREHLKARGVMIDNDASVILWRGVCNLSAWSGKDTIWRINLPRAQAGEVADRLDVEIGGDMFFDWAGARIWLAVPNDKAEHHEAIRKIVGAAGGKAMLFKAPDDLKLEIPVFHPEPKALAALTARVRGAFDPERILNPGRMEPIQIVSQ